MISFTMRRSTWSKMTSSNTGILLLLHLRWQMKLTPYVLLPLYVVYGRDTGSWWLSTLSSIHRREGGCMPTIAINQILDANHTSSAGGWQSNPISFAPATATLTSTIRIFPMWRRRMSFLTFTIRDADRQPLTEESVSSLEVHRERCHGS